MIKIDKAMLVVINFIGNQNNSFNETIVDYKKRIKIIGKNIGVKDILLKKIKHSNKKNYNERKQEETKKLVEQIEKGSLNILLDRKGLKFSSIEFSKYIFDQSNSTQNVIFFIGGSDGVDRKYFKKFNNIISFGDLTWPHMMFKMMLLEQIYRSVNIINKHPYHK